MLVLAMGRKKYAVTLTGAEREGLHGPIAAGTAPARKPAHARVLLKADRSPGGPGRADERIAGAVGASRPADSRVRERYVEEGLEAAPDRRDTEAARPVAAAPPGGQGGGARDRPRGAVPDGGQGPGENGLGPHPGKRWCIPPEADAEFVYRMGDVSDVYERPYDPRYPLVRMDEVSGQLLRETREGLPVRPGGPERADYEYEPETRHTPRPGSRLGYPPGVGGDRAERAEPPAPGPQGARLRDAAGPGPCLAGEAQR